MQGNKSSEAKPPHARRERDFTYVEIRAVQIRLTDRGEVVKSLVAVRLQVQGSA